MVKVTLYMNEKTVEKAKKMAKLNGTSVSKMAAGYFEAMNKSTKDDYNDLPLLKEISGMMYGKMTPEKAKKQYKDYLWKKYK